MIREFHLFAGIGGGIYGGKLLGHHCCGGVEIDEYCQTVLKQRQIDGWMDNFDIYGDIRALQGEKFQGQFDILCGGFPCQAFSTAAHGKNIKEKNIWQEMLRFANESQAPIVFGENVAFKAINQARLDLEKIGYNVKICKLSCSDLGADHQRNRFWLLAVRDRNIFNRLVEEDSQLPKLEAKVWEHSPANLHRNNTENHRRQELKAVGNAQSPMVAATAFRILTNRHLSDEQLPVNVSDSELAAVFDKTSTWIKDTYGKDFGLIHTPTTMANYSAPSMMKHQGCRNFVQVFERPSPLNAEYLMGFPIGASSNEAQGMENIEDWNI